MNPMTMYAAVQLVAERRRDSEATARGRRLARRGDDTGSWQPPLGRPRRLHDHPRSGTGADRAVA